MNVMIGAAAFGVIRLEPEAVALAIIAVLSIGILLTPTCIVLGLTKHRSNLGIAAGLFVGSIAASVLWLASWSGALAPFEESDRVAGPSGVFEGIVGIQPTNATVPTLTKVYVVRRGARAGGPAVFSAYRVDKIALRWEGPETLVVLASTAEPPTERSSVRVGGFWGPKIKVRYETTRQARD